MPSTASGKTYTTRTADLGVHGQCVWTVADDKVGNTGLPAVLYAHGAGGSANQLVTLPAWVGLRDWLIDRGFVLIEGDGGRDYGTQNWGGPEAQAAYPAYLAHVETQLSIGGVVLLGRSMGGLVTAWLASQYSGKARFSGWINNSGVSTLFTGTQSGARDTAAASSWYFSPTVWQPYGATDMASMLTNAAAHAPESWPQASWDGVKVLSLYGTADTTVPAGVRGAEALRPRWAGRAYLDRIHVRPGGDHSGSNGSYLDVAPMVAFLQDVLALTPIPIPPVPTYRQVLRYTIIDGQRRILAATPRSRR